MRAILIVGGDFETPAGQDGATILLDWGGSVGLRIGRSELDRASRALRWLDDDSTIQAVHLAAADCDDEWLAHLAGAGSLRWLDLADRQIGPGLRHLAPPGAQLHLEIDRLSAGRLSELRAIPELKSLGLRRPAQGPLGFAALSDHRNLRSLRLLDTPHLEELLEEATVLSRLETLDIASSRGLSERAWTAIARLESLQTICIVNTPAVDDTAMTQLARLPKLRTLMCCGSARGITDRGVTALGKCPALMELVVSGTDLTPPQVSSLLQQIPRCRITTY